MLADLPIELLPRGQLRQGGTEMALRVAVKATLTAQALPLPEHSPGHHLTPAERGLGARMQYGRQRGLAKVVYHNVKSSQEGVCVDHRGAPYPGEDRVVL